MQLLSPTWSDYELIDAGDFEKLERFGEYVLIRPEPQAIWPRTLPDSEWKHRADAHFTREQKDKFRFSDEVKGGWRKLKQIPDQWFVKYKGPEFELNLRLALTSFGHVGIFPEQGSNWNFLRECISPMKDGRVLNLFAYTGAASMVARLSGAEVTHVDASRPGLNWANQNMQLNKLDNIRWVYEDAFRFVKRELKRGNKYQGIIMDPPPYGRGPEGEKWTLPEQLNELTGMCAGLLSGSRVFFVLSMYAVGLSAVVGRNVLQAHFPEASIDYGEFLLMASKGRDLPMGTFARFVR